MLEMLAHHANKLKFLVNENSTTILTAVGVGGTVATAVLTGRASFKAANIISQEQETSLAEWREGETVLPPHEFSKTEKAKLVWRLYLPPVATSVLTITSIIYANKISSKKIAALAVAGGISERALQEYKDKVVERLGPKQDEKLRDEIAQDRVNANPPRSGEVLIAGSGDVLCYDMLTGRYFQSTVEKIKAAENRINHEIIHYMHASLSMFYEEIGLPPTAYTDSVGWNSNIPVEVKFSATTTEDQRQPCLAIDFTRHPIAEYSDIHWGS
jgi:hypothetical protein